MMRILVTGGSGFIGTNLINVLVEKGIEIVNLDIKPPSNKSHLMNWRQCDILDREKTMTEINAAKPTHLVHLAARTDTLSNDLNDYLVNTEGTKNILDSVNKLTRFARIVITSSQFVFAPPGLPKHDEDFNPIGAYGTSKMISEQATRNAGLDCEWTIIRPTNIWGPWHPRYPTEFWHVLKKGWYVHPGGAPVIRSYGYVGNVVDQIVKILTAPPDVVNGKVFYLGDAPIPLLEWVNEFSLAIRGTRVRVIPRRLFWLLAVAGSLIETFGLRFPIKLSRYRSMTEDYFSPMRATFEALGSPRISLEAGIKETVGWLDEYWNETSRNAGK